MTEKKFEEQVKKWLKEHNAWYVKTWSNGIQRAGIPDLIICWKGRFIGLELKAENGRPSELQKREVDQIKKAGGIAMILYPSGFEDFKKLLMNL